MARSSLRCKLRYWFDNTMARGTAALIGLLAAVSLGVVVVITLLIAVIDPSGDDGGGHHPLLELWRNFLAAFDLQSVEVSGHASFLALRLVLALGGIFLVGALIGILATGLEGRLEELRKGRSLVVEQGHTVLLGWSEQVFAIIPELVEANTNQRRGRVAILAPKDKVEMEDELRAKVGATRNTRVVCRTGDPMDPDDLGIVNPDGARAIMVLTPPGEEPDMQVIKTLLSLANRPGRQAKPLHVVAAITDTRNMAAAALAGGPGTRLVDADDIAARLIVQVSRQSGLSVVYTDLLDFEGDELYMTEEPRLVGTAFGDALLAYRSSAPIGLRHADATVQLNPPMDQRIVAGDQLIAISEDDDTVVLAEEAPTLIEDAIVTPEARAQTQTVAVERALLLGWNRRAPAIVRQMDRYVPPGSALSVVAADTDGQVGEVVGKLGGELERLQVTFCKGQAHDPATLEAVGPHRFDHVTVLSADDLEAQEADSRTLVTLLHLRELAGRQGNGCAIISEMADDRNRQLAQFARADDFVVSQKLISLLMTQVAENPHLATVFADLFDADGSEIYLKPACDFVREGVEIDFYTVVEAARRQGQVAIGYRVQADSHQPPTFGVVLNPDKRVPVTMRPGDRVIVLAEDG